MCEILHMWILSRQKITGNMSGIQCMSILSKRKENKQNYIIYIYLFIMLILSIQRLQNILDLIGLMSIQLIRSNCNVNPNTKYSNYIEHRIKCSNYSRIRFIPTSN